MSKFTFKEYKRDVEMYDYLMEMASSIEDEIQNKNEMELLEVVTIEWEQLDKSNKIHMYIYKMQCETIKKYHKDFIRKYQVLLSDIDTELEKAWTFLYGKLPSGIISKVQSFFWEDLRNNLDAL